MIFVNEGIQYVAPLAKVEIDHAATGGLSQCFPIEDDIWADDPSPRMLQPSPTSDGERTQSRLRCDAFTSASTCASTECDSTPRRSFYDSTNSPKGLLTQSIPADEVNLAPPPGTWGVTTKTPKEAHGVVVSGLVEALNDEQFKVRATATYALGAFGPAIAMHSDAIIDMLHDPHFEVRSASCWAISKLGGDGVPALHYAGALVLSLKDAHYKVRAAAAAGVGTIGVPHPMCTLGLLSALADDSATVRASAVYALGKLCDSASPHAEGYAASIANMMQDEYARVRESAAHAIGRLESAAQPHMKELIGALRDEHAGVRTASANALGNLGHLAKPYAKELAILMMTDVSVDVRSSAAFAMGKLDDAAVPYLDVLTHLANDPRAKLRKAAIRALGRLGYEAISKDGSTYQIRNKDEPYAVPGQGQVYSL